MRRTLRAALALLAFLGAGAGVANAAGRDIVLAAPASGHALWLAVKVGRLARGKEIDVATADGRALGTISPYGIRAGSDAGTYTLPVPADAVQDGKLGIRLSVDERAPTDDEVRSVTLSATPK
jgi:hypothetical protein